MLLPAEPLCWMLGVRSGNSRRGWHTEPEFYNFYGPRHQFHELDSSFEINFCVEFILGRNWRFHNCRRHKLRVINTFPTRKQYGSILWDMADSISYLLPTQFQESIIHPINTSKIPCYRKGVSVMTPETEFKEKYGVWDFMRVSEVFRKNKKGCVIIPDDNITW